MQALSRPSQDGWQNGRVPQLAYRNPLPREESSLSSRQHSIVESVPETTTITDPMDKRKSNGPTIRQIRESMIVNATPQPPAAASLRSPIPPKKKGSIFGGLFAVKEPTQLALNQVAAQMIAQHGSTSAQKVPNVRMEKMPEHVPKVTSKWDGVPDAIKQREKQEKERQRTVKRGSLNAATFRSRSVESDERMGRNRMSVQSRGTHDSHNSRDKSSLSQGSDRRRRNPHRFYAQSVNSSGDLASQQRSEDQQRDHANHPGSDYTHFTQSSSGTSLPESKPLRSNGIFTSASDPKRHGNDTIFRGSEVAESDNLRPVSSVPARIPSVEAIPDHSSSPVATPRERSPVTPSIQQMQELPVPRKNVISMPLEPQGLKLPTHYRQVTRQSSLPFLAGEARELELPDEDMEQPKAMTHTSWIGTTNDAPPIPPRSPDRFADLERRPDSSRTRLGLSASMVVRTEVPWENLNTPTEPSLTSGSGSSRSSVQMSPRYFSTLGSIRKKNI